MPPEMAIRGVRPAQQDLYELIAPGQADALLEPRCGRGSAITTPMTTWTSPTTG